MNRAISRSSVLGCFLFCMLAVFAGTSNAEEEKSQSEIDLDEVDAQIEDADREHWSFTPLKRPQLPKVRNKQWVRNPIDRFVLAELEKKDWSPAKAAAPESLMRRMYLDLIGLPPTLKEQEMLAKETTPAAFDALVSQLLERPGYGERWARHWLDLVRYADSNGYERDAAKPHVWRYRDYVIRSLNEDKPYNRFIIEQLAGDEIDDADTQSVIATGYYRLGAWDDEPADFKTDRFDQLDDMINTTSQTFLGLTLACCRCHDHKFEPLTSHDYYRMAAIFNTLSRPQNGRSELDRPACSKQRLVLLQKRDLQITGQQQQIDGLHKAARAKFLEDPQDVFNKQIVTAFNTPAEKRSDEQKKLVEQNTKQLSEQAASRLGATAKKTIADCQNRIAQLQKELPDPPRGYFLEETSPTTSVSHLMLRGSAFNPGPEVQPGVPTLLAKTQPSFMAPSQYTSRRRLSLAKWIASEDNPLTARVMVNRVWMHHFGVGLVRTPSDFGVMGAYPTHDKLLDWMADWFIHEGDWSLKKLHTLIMTSNSYRMSRQWNEQYAAADPENELLWRTSFHRLEVEVIRDSMLAVSGQLDRKMYGPSIYLYVPKAALEGHSDPDKIWPKFDEKAASRRTVYAFVKRSLVAPFLEVLDLCDTTKTSPQRNVTSVAPQALTLFNGDFVNRQARYLAARLVREAGKDPQRQIHHAYRLAFCRQPKEKELAALLAFLDRETTKQQQEATAAKEPLKKQQAERLALEQMCRVLLNLNEFVYTD